MKKRIRKTFCAILSTAMLFGSTICYADSAFDSIDPAELSKEELVVAYNDLRDTYNILLDLYSQELSGNSNDSYIGSEIETEESKAENPWIIRNYVDDFNRPTDDQYITNEYYINGTFSNSAATDSDLKVLFLIDKDYIRIELYEYGNNAVNNPYSKDKEYSIKALDAKNGEHEVGSYIRSNDRCLIVTDNDEFCRILEYGGEAVFIINETDGMSEYRFTVNLPENFANIYSEIGGQFQNNEEYQNHQNYLQEEEKKFIDGDIEISLAPEGNANLECVILTEIPDGTVLGLSLFKNHKCVDQIKPVIKNGKISHIFEQQLADTVSGDHFEVNVKLIYEEQSEEIQQKLGNGVDEEFYYLDNANVGYYFNQWIASLNYATYTVE